MGLTIDDVRRIAVSLPETEEREHWGRPSFRVKGKIFVTLWPEELRAVLRLSPDIQHELVEEEPEVYSPVAGAWGKRGYTNVQLEQIGAKEFTTVVKLAWREVAPKRLLNNE